MVDEDKLKKEDISPDTPIRERLMDIHYEIREIKGYITGQSTCAFAMKTDPILNKLAEAVALLTKQQNMNVENIERLRKKIDGNGEAGINDRLRQVERDMSVVRWIAIAVGSVMIGLIVVAIYELIVTHGAGL